MGATLKIQSPPPSLQVRVPATAALYSPNAPRSTRGHGLVGGTPFQRLGDLSATENEKPTALRFGPSVSPTDLEMCTREVGVPKELISYNSVP
jgi:hypothetical protein